jgi:hypothetical protein
VSAARRKIKAPRAVVLLAALVACGVGTSCGRIPLESSRDRALEYFASRVRETDPSWSVIFGYLHRRYRVAALDAGWLSGVSRATRTTNSGTGTTLEE